MKTNAQISWQLHQMHSREVYDQVAQVAGLGSLPARRRLEQFLWTLISAQEPTGPQPPIRVPFPLKQWELAQLIAVTPEHLSQVLKQLEQEGILRRDKGWLIVLKPQGLWHRTEY